MIKDWLHGVGYSHAYRTCCRLSEAQRLLLLHLLEPVLLGCCQHQLTALSSVIILHPPLLCEGWGSRPLCLTGDSSVLKDLHWSCACTAHSSILSSVQYLSFFCKTFFWAILDSSSFSLFTVAKLFTSWYALLLDPKIFFSISLQCLPIQFSSGASWCRCSFFCVPKIFQAPTFSFLVLSF